MPRNQTSTDSDETIIGALTSVADAPTAAHLEQLRSTAELRSRFLREVPMLSSVPVTGPLGPWATMKSRKGARRVFSVPSAEGNVYPAFQFIEGQPLAAMREVLEIFAELSEWQIALWFFAPNAWLAEQRPMDLVRSDSESVIRAARRAIEPIEV